jgi:hypothetical protein
MQGFSKKFFIGTLALISLILWGFIFSFSTVQAGEFRGGDDEASVVVDDDLIEDDLYVTGKTVIINSRVQGDIYVAGQDLEINGDVGGKIFAAGMNISINGNVDKTVMVACQNLDINGSIGRSLYLGSAFANINGEVMEDVFGSAATTNINAKVYQDVYVAGAQVKLSEVGEDVFIGAGKANLSGDIGGMAKLAVDSLVSSDVVIDGDVKVYGPEGIRIPDTIEIMGDREIEIIEEMGKVRVNWGKKIAPLSAVSFGFKAIFKIINILGLIFLGFIALKFMPVKINNSLNKMRDGESMLKSLGLGFLSLPLGFFICLMLALSVIGWPMLKVTLALASIIWALGVPLAGIVLGEKIWTVFDEENKISYIRNLVIGVTLIQLLTFIPIFGGLLRFLIVLTAVGAMVRMQWDKFTSAKEA